MRGCSVRGSRGVRRAGKPGSKTGIQCTGRNGGHTDRCLSGGVMGSTAEGGSLAHSFPGRAPREPESSVPGGQGQCSWQAGLWARSPHSRQPALPSSCSWIELLLKTSVGMRCLTSKILTTAIYQLDIGCIMESQPPVIWDL